MSIGKAQEVAQRHHNSIILGADTFIVFNNQILGKPHTSEKAKQMLTELSGKIHLVITGFTIIETETEKTLSQAVETKVHFRSLSEQDIKGYVNSQEPLDKAGAYAIQGLGAVLVKKIEGDYFNVVGLPLSAIVESLKQFNVFVLHR